MKKVFISLIVILLIALAVFYSYRYVIRQNVVIELGPYSCKTGQLTSTQKFHINRLAGLIIRDTISFNYNNNIFSTLIFEIDNPEYIKSNTSGSVSLNNSLNETGGESLLSNTNVPDTDLAAFAECYKANYPAMLSQSLEKQRELISSEHIQAEEFSFTKVYNIK